MINKQKSYGKEYQLTKINVKINKRKLLKLIIIFLFFAEIVLGVLWALGK